MSNDKEQLPFATPEQVEAFNQYLREKRKQREKGNTPSDSK